MSKLIFILLLGISVFSLSYNLFASTDKAISSPPEIGTLDSDAFIKVSDITYRYYKYLSDANILAIAPMLDEEFVVNGVVHFYNKDKALSFLKSMYANSIPDIEISNIAVFNHVDFMRLLSYKKYEDLKLPANLKGEELISIIPKVKVLGKVITLSSYLVFVKKNGTWRIRAMYN